MLELDGDIFVILFTLCDDNLVDGEVLRCCARRLNVLEKKSQASTLSRAFFSANPYLFLDPKYSPTTDVVQKLKTFVDVAKAVRFELVNKY